MEQSDTDGDRNDDMQHEGGGGAEPNQGRTAPSRKDQGREHGLVRKFADKDDGEDGEDDGEIHEDLSVRAEGSLPGAAPCGGPPPS